jgi:hypothetical protein
MANGTTRSCLAHNATVISLQTLRCVIAECNACGGLIGPNESCFRTLGNFYHLTCEDALLPGAPRLKLTANEALQMDDDEFRLITQEEYEQEDREEDEDQEEDEGEDG